MSRRACPSFAKADATYEPIILPVAKRILAVVALSARSPRGLNPSVDTERGRQLCHGLRHLTMLLLCGDAFATWLHSLRCRRSGRTTTPGRSLIALPQRWSPCST